MHTGWYVTITRSRSEMTVASALKELDVTHRSYQVRKQLAKGGEQLLPAYTGYVFTYANADWYRPIKEIDGVLAFLSFDPEGYPSPISEKEIARLDALADENMVFGTYDPTSISYDKGDIVRVLSGPFQHFIGTFQADMNAMVICELDLLNRKVPVTLAYHQIELVKKRKPRNRRVNKHWHLSTPD